MPLSKIEQQKTRSLTENLADLPRGCDFGRKAGSKGYFEIWVGYKLHLDVIDGDIPVSALLSSASVHDSQVAIPLAQMTAQRVCSLYDLMDCAYDAPAIREFSRALGHVPLIEPHPQRVAPGLWIQRNGGVFGNGRPLNGSTVGLRTSMALGLCVCAERSK